jgi:glycosyltransferase involved in cell wall biosynthesis
MKLNPLVSICMPTHNQIPAFLKKSIESALQQTYKNIEIVINNNNTTNESLLYLKKLSESEEAGKIIKIFTNEHTVGLIESNEQAMHHSTGDYLLILNSDDFLEKNAIEVLVNTLQEHPDADCICGQWRYVDKEFNEVSINRNQRQPYYENKESHIYDSLAGKNNYIVFSFLRAEYIKNIDISMNKKLKTYWDVYCTNQITLHGKVIAIDNIIGNFQNYNPSRDGGRAISDLFDRTEILYKTISDIFEDKNLKNKISKKIIAKIIFLHFCQKLKSLMILALKLKITAIQLINTLIYLVKMTLSLMILLIKL